MECLKYERFVEVERDENRKFNMPVLKSFMKFSHVKVKKGKVNNRREDRQTVKRQQTPLFQYRHPDKHYLKWTLNFKNIF